MTFFKLGKMTFGSLFKKPITTRYPFESRPQPVGLKGQIGIDVDSCILCGACQKNCTTGCLEVSRTERYWQINRYGCIQCGYCTTVCPKNCLTMLPDYAAASPEKVESRFEIPRTEENDKPTKKEMAAGKTGATPADSKSKPAEMLPNKAEVERIESQDLTVTQADEQLEDLLALMDADRAQFVKDALRHA